MKKLILGTFVLGTLLAINGCDKKKKNVPEGFSKAAEGFYYKIHKDASGRNMNVGDHITFAAYIKTPKGETVFERRNMNDQIAGAYFEYGFTRALLMMSEGDSATFIYHADSLVKQQIFDPNNMEKLDSTKNVMVTFAIQKHQTPQEFRIKQEKARAEQMKQFEDVQKKNKEADLANEPQIEEYISKNNLKAEKLASGLRIVRVSPGKGDKLKPGQTASVIYTGTLLNGTQFDSNKGKEAFDVNVGQGGVIQGWQEALQNMQNGEKVKVIIPSSLAYGSESNPASPIPANSPLVFDMEIVGVK